MSPPLCRPVRRLHRPPLLHSLRRPLLLATSPSRSSCRISTEMTLLRTSCCPSSLWQRDTELPLDSSRSRLPALWCGPETSMSSPCPSPSRVRTTLKSAGESRRSLDRPSPSRSRPLQSSRPSPWSLELEPPISRLELLSQSLPSPMTTSTTLLFSEQERSSMPSTCTPLERLSQLTVSTTLSPARTT